MEIGIADHSSFEITLPKFLNFASQLHVQIVELRMDSQYMMPTIFRSHKIREVRDILQTFNFKYFIHAPSIDINLASLNLALRKTSEKLILKTLEVSSKLDVRLVVSHVGRLSRDYPKSMVNKAINNVLTCIKRIVKASKELDIVFSIENDHSSSDYILAGFPKQVKFLVENSGCGFTFDIGHANTLGKINDFLELMEQYMVSVHLHDNDGTRDSHLALGKGNIDFESLLEKMKKDKITKPLIIECHSFRGLAESVKFLKNLL